MVRNEENFNYYAGIDFIRLFILENNSKQILIFCNDKEKAKSNFLKKNMDIN